MLLDQLQPHLEANKLLLTQPIINGFVMTVIEDLDGDGKYESSLKLPEIQDPQKIGSAITYYRRYTLASLLGLQAEDDDGNMASQPVKPQNEPEKKWLNRLDKDKNVTPEWSSTLAWLDKGNSLAKLRDSYKVNKENWTMLEQYVETLK
jgi:hypothetical protein